MSESKSLFGDYHKMAHIWARIQTFDRGLRIEDLCDIILKAQSWLVLNLPVFMFVYINFNAPPTRITDLVRNVSDEKIYSYGTFTLSASMFLLLSTWFVFSQLYS